MASIRLNSLDSARAMVNRRSGAPTRTGLRRRQRQAMTLVELMIVVAMLILLMASAIPILRPLLGDRKMREAARQVNGYLIGAKARAAALDRPVGVWIQRDPNNPNAARQLFIAEVPPPYRGDVISAKATLISVNQIGSPNIATAATFPLATSASMSPLPNRPISDWFVKPGDLIRFGGRGPFYIIRWLETDTSVTPPIVRVYFLHPEAEWARGADGEWGVAGVNDDAFSGNVVVGDYTERGWAFSDDVLVSTPAPMRVGVVTSYEVLRNPQRSAVGGLVLPNGITIDLSNSGMGLIGRQFLASSNADRTPVLIMFNPDGSVIRVDALGATTKPSEAVFLQLGKSDQVRSFPNSLPASSLAPMTVIPFNNNMIDKSNLWVAVGIRTGNVTTAENAWELASDNRGAHPFPTMAGSMRNARRFAADAQTPTGGN